MGNLLTITLASALLLFSDKANALVLWGLDGAANQTNPGGGVPWGAVAKVTNSDGSLIQGSAVYLGDGFMLTANHVTMNLQHSFVTFDQVEIFSIDPMFNDGVRSYGKQVGVGVDLAVFKLNSIPVNATGAVLMPAGGGETFGAGAAATLVGWGVGRDPLSAPGANTVTWGDSSTAVKRWGLNAPRTAINISYNLASEAYNYGALVTYAGNTNSLNPNNKGLGANEAGATLYDSGSGLFQESDGQWRLIGITTAVQTSGSTTFGADAVGGGDGNYFVRVASYEQDIMAIVPEPTTASLLVAGMLAIAILTKRHRTPGTSFSKDGEGQINGRHWLVDNFSSKGR